jgi:flagellar biosynthesis/type III secretory pathway chaperone
MTNSNTDYLSQIIHKANALKRLLEGEFDALKKQDLATFETLQTQKMTVLNFLSSEELLAQIKAYNADPSKAQENSVIWDQMMNLIAECRDLHRRNEVLINHKLDTIRGALQTIQLPDPLNSVEIYDRLGKMRPNRNRKPVADA